MRMNKVNHDCKENAKIRMLKWMTD
jgi:hypothetical protein